VSGSVAGFDDSLEVWVGFDMKNEMSCCLED
jgi:hypothetical protein